MHASELFKDAAILSLGGVTLLWFATADFHVWGASAHAQHVLTVLRECCFVWVILVVLGFLPSIRHFDRAWVLGAYYCCFVLPSSAVLLASVLALWLDIDLPLVAFRAFEAL